MFTLPIEKALFKWIAFVFVLVGLGLRLAQMASLHEFRGDELMNVFFVYVGSWTQYVNDSLLHENFSYPPLFFLGFKYWSHLFGRFEYAPWLFVFCLNAAALVVFSRITQRNLGALFFLVFSFSAIHWASEAKQYSADLFIATLFLGAFLLYEKDRILWPLLLLGVAGSWVSFPSVFFLGTIVPILLFDRIQKKDKRIVWVLSLWAASFLLLWDQVLISKTAVPKSLNYWAPYFELSLNELRKGLGYRSLLPLALLLACGLSFKNKRMAWLCLGPLMIACLAGFMKKYPLVDRTLLFCLPGVFWMVGLGVNTLWKKARLRPAVALLLFVVALHNVVGWSAHMEKPFDRGVKARVDALHPFLKDGDTIEIEGQELAWVAYYGWLKGWGEMTPKTYRTPRFVFRTIITDPKKFGPMRDLVADFSTDIQVHLKAPTSHTGRLWRFKEVPDNLPSPLLASLTP